jgi:RND family efflux transporter MFP subunit
VVALVDNTAMRVTVSLVETDIGLVKIGQDARLTVDAYPKQVFRGRVQRLVKAVDPRTRTMLVEIDIPNHDDLLRPGMFGRVAITVAVHPGALVAPANALAVHESGAYVFTTGGKTAHRKKVKLGYDDGERVEITEGLDVADLLVTMGQDLLADGAAVEMHLETSAPTLASGDSSSGGGAN